MRRSIAPWFRLFTALLFFAGLTTAVAQPVISVDLAPLTPGIQSTLTVEPGDTFTIDVVVTGDNVATFDAFPSMWSSMIWVQFWG